ncbi:hypothetical protein [Rhizobium sp. BK176]|uniref:hypothetical protein n=1 Tax=Rhizobium sp. BK176 TaxID=2587071 RepID=UPI002167B6CD|nr:hypothetical protein [Rhizobium sp. BK176]MCS4088672.1 hypothetical protein [Rhizobium sp. BK176]
MVTDAKLKSLLDKAAKLDEEIEAAVNREATWFEDRYEWFTEWIDCAVCVPIAFVMIVWCDFVDWIDDAIWKLKNRHG